MLVTTVCPNLQEYPVFADFIIAVDELLSQGGILLPEAQPQYCDLIYIVFGFMRNNFIL